MTTNTTPRVRYFTTAQAAAELGTNRRLIWSLVSRGELEAVELTRPGAARRQWRISAEVVEAQKNRPSGVPIGSGR